MPALQHLILIHKRLAGEINSRESAQLDAWLSSDPLNRSEFDEIETIWKDTDPGPEIDEQAGVERLVNDLHQLESSIKESGHKDRQLRNYSRRNRYMTWMVLVLATTAVALAILVNSAKYFETNLNANNIKDHQLLLSDSTRIVLNDSSSITVRTTDRRRETHLSGEALFEVRSEARPFVVNAGDVAVTVFGTSFIVRAYPETPVEVIVISGSVEVAYMNDRVTLEGGEKSVVTGDQPLRKARNNDPNFNAWYTETLLFNKTPLEEVLIQLEKQFDASFEVTDPKILRCRLTGQFLNATLEDIIGTLSYSLDIEFSLRKGKYYMVSGKGCT